MSKSPRGKAILPDHVALMNKMTRGGHGALDFEAFGFWYLFSIIANVFNYRFLLDYNCGLAHCFVRWGGCTLFSLLMGGIFPSVAVAWAEIPNLWLACVTGASNDVMTMYGITQVGIGLTMVIKSSLPVLTCIYCFLVEGQKFSRQCVFCVVICSVGVAMVCAADLNFNWTGFLMLSAVCFGQLAQNILFKNFLVAQKAKGSSLKASNVLSTQCLISFLLVLVAYMIMTKVVDPEGLFVDPKNLVLDRETNFYIPFSRVLTDEYSFSRSYILIGLSMAYYGEMVFNHRWNGSAEKVTYTLTDVLRRLVIIMGSFLFASDKPINALQICGTMLSSLGAVGYAMSLDTGDNKKEKSSDTDAEQVELELPAKIKKKEM